MFKVESGWKSLLWTSEGIPGRMSVGQKEPVQALSDLVVEFAGLVRACRGLVAVRFC